MRVPALCSLLCCIPTLLAAPAGAQTVDAGEPAPDFGGEWYNLPDNRLSGLLGRVVYLEFWGSHIDENWERDRVSYLKRLTRDYEDQGLVILAITTVEQEEIEEAIRDWWIDFPVVWLPEDEGEEIEDRYGGRAAIVDSQGVLNWRGSTWGISNDRLEDLLQDASLIPLLSGDYEKINRYLRFVSLDRGKAHKELSKAYGKDPEVEELARAMDGMNALVEILMQHVEGLVEERDYGAANARLEKMMADWKGSGPADQARLRRIDLKRDPDAKRDIKAYDAFMEAEHLRRIRKYEDAREGYEKIIRNFAGTRCAERSEHYLAQIRNK